jgi:hypothetical protein
MLAGQGDRPGTPAHAPRHGGPGPSAGSPWAIGTIRTGGNCASELVHQWPVRDADLSRHRNGRPPSPLVRIPTSGVASFIIASKIEGVPHTDPARAAPGGGTPDDRASHRTAALPCRGTARDQGEQGQERDIYAAALKWSPSKISRYERVDRLTAAGNERLLDYYEITGARRTLCLRYRGRGPEGMVGGVRGRPSPPTISGSSGGRGKLIAIWHVDVPGFTDAVCARHHRSQPIEPIAPGMIERLVRVRCDASRC